jgi:hypothetical protein
LVLVVVQRAFHWYVWREPGCASFSCTHARAHTFSLSLSLSCLKTEWVNNIGGGRSFVHSHPHPHTCTPCPALDTHTHTRARAHTLTRTLRCSCTHAHTHSHCTHSSRALLPFHSRSLALLLQIFFSLALVTESRMLLPLRHTRRHLSAARRRVSVGCAWGCVGVGEGEVVRICPRDEGTPSVSLPPFPLSFAGASIVNITRSPRLIVELGVASWVLSCREEEGIREEAGVKGQADRRRESGTRSLRGGCRKGGRHAAGGWISPSAPTVVGLRVAVVSKEWRWRR